MTVSDLSAADRGSITPRIPVNPPPGPPPPDEQPTVTIQPPTGRVVARVPTTVTVAAFPGVHWVWSPADQVYEDHPVVAYAQTEVDFDNAAIRDHTGGGGTYQLTFAAPG